MRLAISWIVGIGAYFLLFSLADHLAVSIHVPLRVQYDFPIWVSDRYGDYEQTGSVTDFGLAILALCGMLAARIGMAIYAGHWQGGVSRQGNWTFLAWLFGLAVFAVLAALVDLASRGFESDTADWLFVAIKIAAGIGIWISMLRWRRDCLDRRS